MAENTNVQVNINVSQINEKTKNAAIKAVAILTNQVLKDSNYYIPFDTGNLKKSGILSTKLNEGVIKWQTPYAHAQYYGLPNKSKARNPNACQKWFEVAKSKNLTTWEKIANDEFSKNFK
jgi:hypothetical protein